MKKKPLLLFLSLLSINLNALTLQEAVSEVMDNNPIVQERLKNYRATREDLHIAESEYYPTLDLRLTYGHTNAGDLKTNNPGDAWNNYIEEKSYNSYESSLIFTYNLFNGFGTTNKVDYEEARLLAAGYNYIEKLNDIAFKTTGAYLNLLKSYELVEAAKENVTVNTDIYKRVKELYDNGLTSFSEVKKIEASLSLAKSNLIVRMNNARDSEFNFKRLLGRMVDVKELKEPTIDVPLPKSLQRATQYALKHNPSLIVSRYNIKGAEALYRQSKKDYYPKVDLEVSQFYNDNNYPDGLTGFDTPDDRFRVRLVLTYNLYRGGADKAKIQKMVSKINQEVDIKRDLKRQVIEGLELSWSAYDYVSKQLEDLKKYKKFSDKTVELYKEEYSLGRRSLLDLLAAQNDAINAKIQIINAKYTTLFAKYRILDAMGLLPLAVLGDTKTYTSKVNLYLDDNNITEVLDTIPVKYDVDNDMIADDLDLCDNSISKNNILADGCVAHKVDIDEDGVEDTKDQCLATPNGVRVDQFGCAIDKDKDGVVDYKDDCLDTPKGYKVDQKGCAISAMFYGNFHKDSATLPSYSYKNIHKLATFLKKHPTYKVKIVAYVNKDTKKSDSFYKKLAYQRAKNIKQKLISYKIKPQRIFTEAKGVNAMQYDPNTAQGRYKNNKIQFVFIK